MTLTINILAGAVVNPMVMHAALFRHVGVSAGVTGDEPMQDDGWHDADTNDHDDVWHELAGAAAYALLCMGGLLLVPGIFGFV